MVKGQGSSLSSGMKCSVVDEWMGINISSNWHRLKIVRLKCQSLEGQHVHLFVSFSQVIIQEWKEIESSCAIF